MHCCTGLHKACGDLQGTGLGLRGLHVHRLKAWTSSSWSQMVGCWSNSSKLSKDGPPGRRQLAGYHAYCPKQCGKAVLMVVKAGKGCQNRACAVHRTEGANRPPGALLGAASRTANGAEAPLSPCPEAINALDMDMTKLCEKDRWPSALLPPAGLEAAAVSRFSGG